MQRSPPPFLFPPPLPSPGVVPRRRCRPLLRRLDCAAVAVADVGAVSGAVTKMGPCAASLAPAWVCAQSSPPCPH